MAETADEKSSIEQAAAQRAALWSALLEAQVEDKPIPVYWRGREELPFLLDPKSLAYAEGRGNERGFIPIELLSKVKSLDIATLRKKLSASAFEQWEKYRDEAFVGGETKAQPPNLAVKAIYAPLTRVNKEHSYNAWLQFQLNLDEAPEEFREAVEERSPGRGGMVPVRDLASLLDGIKTTRKFDQVLDVLRRTRDAGPKSLDELSRARKAAANSIAAERGIDERTVADKCWRGLRRTRDEDFHIADFDELAWSWISRNDDSLKSRCLDAATRPDDREAIRRLFEGVGGVVTKSRRFRIERDCVVWVEPYQDEASIVVNSVGGGPDRRPGLARLLAELAKRHVNVVGVAYHPSKREAVQLDGLPLSPEAVLRDPADAAQRTHTILGRLEGANQGSRLRLMLKGSSSEDLEKMLSELEDGPVGSTSGKEIVEHVHKSLRAEGLDFSVEQVADFYLAVRTKPFVLLAGISGTGKSILARRFAEACGFEATIIPVRPDWSDPSELIGYRNLEDAFVPGRLLPELVAALREPRVPRFVVLDEMNLARVEHYFADFLSLLETRRRRGGAVVTDAIDLRISASTEFRCDDDLKEGLQEVLANGGLAVPPNLCFVGTVNMDESTHPFSKKVLDRAMTLEFVTVNLTHVPAKAELPQPRTISADDLAASWLSLSEVYPGREERFDPGIGLLIELNQHLEQLSAQVGYRTRDEICLYLHHNAEESLLDPGVALDLAVYHKVLPRIQGGEEVQEVLEGVRQTLERHHLPRCIRKIAEMQSRLQRAGFTAFWS